MAPKPEAETPKADAEMALRRDCLSNYVATHGDGYVDVGDKKVVKNTPSHQITKSPTVVLKDKDNYIAVVAWTDKLLDADKQPHVFFFENSVLSMLGDLARKGGDSKRELSFTPEDGAPCTCKVSFAFVKYRDGQGFGPAMDMSYTNDVKNRTAVTTNNTGSSCIVWGPEARDKKEKELQGYREEEPARRREAQAEKEKDPAQQQYLDKYLKGVDAWNAAMTKTHKEAGASGSSG